MPPRHRHCPPVLPARTRKAPQPSKMRDAAGAPHCFACPREVDRAFWLTTRVPTSWWQVHPSRHMQQFYYTVRLLGPFESSGGDTGASSEPQLQQDAATSDESDESATDGMATSTEPSDDVTAAATMRVPMEARVHKVADHIRRPPRVTLAHDDYFQSDVSSLSPDERMPLALRTELRALHSDVLVTPRHVHVLHGYSFQYGQYWQYKCAWLPLIPRRQSAALARFLPSRRTSSPCFQTCTCKRTLCSSPCHLALHACCIAATLSSPYALWYRMAGMGGRRATSRSTIWSTAQPASLSALKAYKPFGFILSSLCETRSPHALYCSRDTAARQLQWAVSALTQPSCSARCLRGAARVGALCGEARRASVLSVVFSGVAPAPIR